MRVLRILLASLLLSGNLAWSQAHAATEADTRRWEIYGGPVFSGSNPSGATFGAGGGLTGNFSRWFGAQGEFTMIRTTCCVVNNITVTDYLAGPRISRSLTRSRISPFADFLLGAQQLTNSSNHHAWFYGAGSGPAIAADGGLTLRLTSHLAFRGQAGYIYSRFTGGSSSVSNSRWRAATYVAYRF